MNEGQVEECRATVQVHVVAVDCPKTVHQTRDITYWQVENTAEATAGMGDYDFMKNEW